MNLVQKFFTFIILCQIVPFSHQYVFDYAEVLIKRIDKPNKHRGSYGPLLSIDPEYFADVVNIKVKTDHMKMYKGAVKNLPHLQKLRLKDCGIDDLEPGCFMELPSLEVVHLQDNDLPIIRSGVFNYFRIRELWLQRNEIGTIDSEAFDNMPNLEVIRLNKNFLKVWDSKWFADTPKLKQLFFKRNKIEELPARAFANIKTTHKINGTESVDTSIYLSNNRISVIDPEAFYGIDSLYELQLQRNALKEIDSQVFSHITELKKLNLSVNSISKIDENTFENLDEMLHLNLSHNSLTCVPYKIVSIVKFIDVSGNSGMKCDCLDDLREKLSEDGISSQVINNDAMCV